MEGRAMMNRLSVPIATGTITVVEDTCSFNEIALHMSLKPEYKMRPTETYHLSPEQGLLLSQHLADVARRLSNRRSAFASRTSRVQS
jgi:hypothetical protein